jgi:FkbM family methyltransferase
MTEIALRPLSPALRAYRFVNRPYYWYRPSQLAIRLRAKPDADRSLRLVRAAWGSHLYCWPDPLGLAVARTGVYDLVVAETLARLAGPGETAVDAGANVGFMTDLLAHAVGPGGRVISFEPHPLIFDTLTRNVLHWRTHERIDTVSARQDAVSSSAGSHPLSVDPATFEQNKGTASLEQVGPAHAAEVSTVRLDDQLSGAIGVLKLDVEGHELAALKGAESLIAGGRIRDIVFEEHRPPPTPVTSLLEASGYTVLGVRQGLAGPMLTDAGDAFDRKLWDPPALLATNDPQRARQRLARRGWLCLRRGLGNGRR